VFPIVYHFEETLLQISGEAHSGILSITVGAELEGRVFFKEGLVIHSQLQPSSDLLGNLLVLLGHLSDEDNDYLVKEYRQTTQEREIGQYGQLLIAREYLEEEELESLLALQLNLRLFRLLAQLEYKANFIHKKAVLFKNTLVQLQPNDILAFLDNLLAPSATEQPYATLLRSRTTEESYDLSVTSLGAVLWKLRLIGFDGTLELEDPPTSGVCKGLRFDGGIPTDLLGFDQDEALATLLVTGKYLSPKDAAELQDAARDRNLSFSEVLTGANGLFDQATLARHLVTVRRRGCLTLLQLGRGTARLVAAAPGTEHPNPAGTCKPLHAKPRTETTPQPPEEEELETEPSFVDSEGEVPITPQKTQRRPGQPAPSLRFQCRGSKIEILTGSVILLAKLYRDQLSRGVLELRHPKAAYYKDFKVFIRHERDLHGPYVAVSDPSKRTLVFQDFSHHVDAKFRKILFDLHATAPPETKKELESLLDLSLPARIKVTLALHREQVFRRLLFPVLPIVAVLALALGLLFALSREDDGSDFDKSTITRREALNAVYKSGDIRTIEKDSEATIFLVLNSGSKIEVTREVYDQCDTMVRKKINILRRMK